MDLNEKINLMYILLDLQDDILSSIKTHSEVKNSFKMRLSNLKNGLKTFVDTAKTLQDIESFDHDKELLLFMIEKDAEISRAGKSDEFIKYLKNYEKNRD